jgi:uncharacterized membrane protein YgcG
LIGTAGKAVALYTGERLHRILEKEPSFKEGNYEKALKGSFLNIDEAMRQGALLGDDIIVENSRHTRDILLWQALLSSLFVVSPSSPPPLLRVDYNDCARSIISVM